ncbi:cysteine--tRNA ligase [Frigidibacter oleivorans]|uniref:cysteine--tRNA ligase n=1 Tax=Frigidibacter oleivorans TaxID=2487129 RepID=UPI000F8DA609|nr:cysteine--tRNA ligase [Frigidibacter oleivorans]
MVEIRLTNSRTRRKEVFTPIDASDVRMYVCGPTVYDRAHLGNARPVVVFDMLFRLLRHVYGPDHVRYVRNFTDVDDKINAAAQARKAAGAGGSLEELIRARTEETIGWYHADMAALGALPPTAEPRATDFIGQMIAMIGILIERGHAYAAEGHVLFRVRSYRDYGALSGRSVDDMIAGARVEVAPFKEDPMDFVLWKPSDASLPGWDSPWGRGRPGWHIECSAMSHELLGDSFDIHGGGIDLQFPHHENEIAQSCCAHPEGGFARVWMHNEMLLVEGKKMSKSLGNFFTVRDLLDRGVPGEVIRFVFLSTHYGKPMDWTEKKQLEASKAIRKMAGMLGMRGTEFLTGLEEGKPLNSVVDALADDMNTHGALHALDRSTLQLAYRELDLIDIIPDIYASQRLLGFDLKGHPEAWARAIQHDETMGIVRSRAPSTKPELLVDLEVRMVQLRAEATSSKNFSAVDALKAALTAAGVEVRMSKAGVELLPGPGFDPSKLEALK